jgi:predicted nucleic acid-binding protein
VELIDTNVIIRHVVQDHADHAARSRRLFQEVDRGERLITTTEGVLVEAVQVLSSPRLYALTRAEIQGQLSSFLALEGLHLPHKAVYLRALGLYATSNLDFVDCLNVAYVERAGYDAILSFDHGYDRIAGVRRREP